MSGLDHYLKHLLAQRRTERSVESYGNMLEAFRVWLEDAQDVADWRDVTQSHIAQYAVRLDRHRKPDGSRTTKGYQHAQLYAIKSFFRFLKNTGGVLVDPCEHMAALRRSRSLPRCVLNAEQTLRMLQVPHLLRPFGFRDRCILELLYSTGLRGKEVCQLEVYDLDLENRLVRVRQGKGRKDRIVPLGKTAAAYLREYMDRVRPLFFRNDPGKAAINHLFVTQQRTPIRQATLWYLVKRCGKAAGLPAALTTHSLRHTCATEMLKGGASIRHVQEMLGHSQIRTTQVYTRVVPVDLQAVHRKTAPSERRAVRVPRFKAT